MQEKDCRKVLPPDAVKMNRRHHSAVVVVVLVLLVGWIFLLLLFVFVNSRHPPL